MSPTRREVLIAGLAAAAAGAAPMAVARNGSSPKPAERRPLPPLDGELRVDDASTAGAADDFGHIVHRTPEAVLLPASDQDVATTIRWVGGRGRSTLAPRGQGHSVFGRSQVRQGVVANMNTLPVVRDIENDRIVVDAGATWREVLAATLPRGLTPPVLTDYLDLSVGGTLVVGGVGGTTSRFGVQSDNVLEMVVVTGRGQRLMCSASRNADLFDAMRAGLGQAGVITKATLKLVAAPESVRRFLLFYPDLATMLKDERLLSGDDRFDAVQGAIVATPSGGFAFRLDAAKYFSGKPSDDTALLAGLSDDRARRQPATIAYFEYLNRLAALEAALRANGQWFFPHPWLTTFIGDSHAESVVDAELGALNPPADLGPLGQVVLSPIRRSEISSPLLRMPPDDLCYAFNLIRIPASDDPNEASRLVDANRATYRRVKHAGGTLYPVSALALSPREWRDHFGPAFSQLEAAKRKFDPGKILTPGYELF